MPRHIKSIKIHFCCAFELVHCSRSIIKIWMQVELLGDLRRAVTEEQRNLMRRRATAEHQRRCGMPAIVDADVSCDACCLDLTIKPGSEGRRSMKLPSSFETRNGSPS